MRRARAGETRPESLIVCMHRLWPGRNLLRGTIGRAGSGVLVAAFLAGAALVALASGPWADAAGLRAEHAGRPGAGFTRVLRQEDPKTARARFQPPPEARARAGWPAARGLHTCEIYTPAGPGRAAR